jgi:hypothetical protein
MLRLPLVIDAGNGVFRELWSARGRSIFETRPGGFFIVPSVVDEHEPAPRIVRFDSFAAAYFALSGEGWPQPQEDQS